MPLRFTLGCALAASICLLGLAGPVRAQIAAPAELTSCLLLPVEPATRAQAAGLVVEAEVLGQESFWSTDQRHIYTANTLRVYKVLKGSWPAGQPLVVITEGGTVDLARETLTNTLALSPGEQGLLFLRPARFAGLPRSDTWEAYASEQGFVRYDLATGTAAEPFRRYPALDQAFYRAQTKLTGQPLRELTPNAALAAARTPRQGPAQRTTAPIITGLSPVSITAGTNSVLTITGTGFGNAPGTVEFRNADDGGATAARVAARDVLSWSDTRIQVRVPSAAEESRPAGTGPVRVVTSGQLATFSPQSVEIRYAITNAQESMTLVPYPTVLFGQNARGGYDIQPDPAMASNAPALAAVERAVSNWRCQTQVNWRLGGTRAARGIANDNVNALEFGQGTEIPDNVLGRTTSYYQGCRTSPTGDIRFWVKEFDMAYNNSINWQFGPAQPSATQFDFETVVLHELGHAQQLSHIIAPPVGNQPGAVMHYAIGRGRLNRQLDPARDVEGGLVVIARSVQQPSCGPAPMQLATYEVALTATAGVATVGLSWTLANECGVRQFVLERSADRTNWTTVAQLPARGNGSTYTYNDPQPLPDLSYYRLRVVLPDGRTQTSLPVGVRPAGGARLAVTPNPVLDDEFEVEYEASSAGELQLRVYDAAGRRIGEVRVAVPQPGVNILPVRLPRLAAGWYVLRWSGDGRQGSVPFVRVR